MNTTLHPTRSTLVDTRPHPPHHATLVVRRVGLTDRLALRLGLALVTWSRRPSSATPSRQLVLQRAQREWLAQRTLHLTVPRR